MNSWPLWSRHPLKTPPNQLLEFIQRHVRVFGAYFPSSLSNQLLEPRLVGCAEGAQGLCVTCPHEFGSLIMRHVAPMRLIKFIHVPVGGSGDLNPAFDTGPARS